MYTSCDYTTPETLAGRITSCCRAWGAIDTQCKHILNLPLLEPAQTWNVSKQYLPQVLFFYCPICPSFSQSSPTWSPKTKNHPGQKTTPANYAKWCLFLTSDGYIATVRTAIGSTLEPTTPGQMSPGPSGSRRPPGVGWHVPPTTW